MRTLKLFFDPHFIIILALIAATTAFFLTFERYRTNGPELLADPEFRQGLAQWKRHGRGTVEITGSGAIRIKVRSGEKNAAISQTLDSTGFDLLRLSGELRTRNIQVGQQRWQQARLVLQSARLGGERNGVEPVVYLSGSNTWQRYHKVVTLPEYSATMNVRAQVLGATGDLEVRSLSLRPVVEQTGFPLYRNIGIGMWILLALSLAWRLPGQMRFDLPHILLYAVIVATITGIMIPSELQKSLNGLVGSLLPLSLQDYFITNEPGVLDTHDYRIFSKVGHGVFFAVTAFLLSWARREMRAPQVLLLLLLLAGVTETLQFFANERTPHIKDVAIDGAGILLGLIVAGLLLPKRKKSSSVVRRRRRNA